MSIYEKQMQWKKAADSKAKKIKEEQEQSSSYSFEPVLYTNSVSSHKAESDGKTRNNRGDAERDGGKSTRHGNASVTSHHSKNENYLDEFEHEKQGHRGSTHTSGKNGHYRAIQEEDDITENVKRKPNRHSRSSKNGPSDRKHSRHDKAPSISSDDHGSHFGDDREPISSPSIENDSQGHSNPHTSQKGRRDAVNGNEKQRSSKRNSNIHSELHKNAENTTRKNSRRQTRNSSTGARSFRDDTQRGYHSHGGSTNSSKFERDDIANSSISTHSSTGDDEPLIELIERERRQWREEREKLIQCIHLQQLELTQRSLAAHERAVDIAKEFARAIESFEERLVTVEGTVQKEIMSIKTIAETLLQAATSFQPSHMIPSNSGMVNNNMLTPQPQNMKS